MKKTGITRRIDNLGRIVIPKEIRGTLRIKNGDNLEIFVDDKEDIILRKFSIIDKLGDLSEAITKAISTLTKTTAIIIDNDKITAINGKHKKSYEEVNISNELSNLITETNDIYIGKGIYLTEEKKVDENFIIVPINANGDKIGALVILSEEEITNEDQMTCKVFSSFLGKYVE